MGGILSAEVTLLTSSSSDVFGAQQFRHRILGTINFDCPFLGLHPGIVLSGIGSLFRSTPSPPRSQVSCSDTEDQVLDLHPKHSSRASSPLRTPLTLGSIGSEADLNSGASSKTDENIPTRAFEDYKSQNSAGEDTSLHPSLSDPNYDPPFPNDIRLPERKGWDNTLHFITKHSHHLTKAATAYVTSHLEFGACVADYKGLKNRYIQLRPLEDIQPLREGARRVRFVNYYTICHGRPKKQTQATARRHSENYLQHMPNNPSSSTLTTQSPMPSPRISIEEHRDGEVVGETAGNFSSLQISGERCSSYDESNIMSKENTAEDTTGRSGSISHALESSTGPKSSSALESSAGLESSVALESSVLTPTTSDDSYPLAPLPSFPAAPHQYDPASYPDRESRNTAHKQYSTEFKSYMRSLKAYDQAMSDRLKSIEKQEKVNEKIKKLSTKSKSHEGTKPQTQLQLQPQSQPQQSAAGGSSHDLLSSSSSPPPTFPPPSSPTAEQNPTTPPKDRRFCILPPRINGQRDPCWIRVFMKDVDEVGAHCGLFVPGEHYAWLVDDVGGRIRGWVEGEG